MNYLSSPTVFSKHQFGVSQLLFLHTGHLIMTLTHYFLQDTFSSFIKIIVAKELPMYSIA